MISKEELDEADKIAEEFLNDVFFGTDCPLGYNDCRCIQPCYLKERHGGF